MRYTFKENRIYIYTLLEGCDATRRLARSPFAVCGQRPPGAPLLRPEAPPRGELPIHNVTLALAAPCDRAGLAFSQQSPDDDPADGFLRKAIPGSGYDADDDHGDDEALAGD